MSKYQKRLDFSKEKVQTLTLEELGATHLENYPNGMPVGDIHHFDLISRIVDMCQSNGLTLSIGEIFAANNQDKHNPGVTKILTVEEIEGEGSLESHILRRVFCNMEINSIHNDEEHYYNIALSYTQAGILIGFGPMVRVCHNQTIINDECLISNYTLRGYQRLTPETRSIDSLLARTGERIASLRSQMDRDFEVVERLKNFTLNPDEQTLLLGRMVIERAVALRQIPLPMSTG